MVATTAANCKHSAASFWVELKIKLCRAPEEGADVGCGTAYAEAKMVGSCSVLCVLIS